MKLPPTSVLSKAGVNTPMRGMKYAYKLLWAATAPGESLIVRPAMVGRPANPLNPEINNNELFPGSPYIPAGAARPPFPAIVAPKVAALPDARKYLLDYDPQALWLYLPIIHNADIVGAGSMLQLWQTAGEITPKGLTPSDWFSSGSVIRQVPVQPPGITVEQYFLKCAIEQMSRGDFPSPYVARVEDVIWRQIYHPCYHCIINMGNGQTLNTGL